MQKLLVALLITVGVTAAHAQNTHGVYGSISTLGLGAGYKYSFSPNFGIRAGYNAYDLNGDATERGVNYDGKLKMRTLEVLGDYHPFANGFAITAGFMYNDSKLTARGTTGAGSITINGVTYTGANPQANYENKLDSDQFSPYLGIGWESNPKGRPGWAFNARLGVMFQDPKGSLSTSGITDVGGTLEANRAQAERELNQDVDKLKTYPVLGIGVSYTF